ncbi:AAA family ATPase [Candidatus Halobeggiatoa sp. HSG11]|nr:AAA family ATPase [Candidatus Halobeggiatoa sp. HSG11]
MTIYEFRPIALTLENIGPFTNPYEINFVHENGQPCNFYMLVAPNGFGKTTVFNTFTSLISLLGTENPKNYGQEDLDSGRGRAQLDILIRVHWEGRDHQFILSILAGCSNTDLSLKVWSKNDLQKHQSEHWYRCGYFNRVAGKLEPLISNSSNDFVADFLTVIQTSIDTSPEHFGESLYHGPTLMYFSAYRDIPPININSQRNITKAAHWGYQTVHRFMPHDETWSYSLDNLLFWLKWLDDGRFEKARDLINKQLFYSSEKHLEDVRREPPEAIIRCTDESTHRLDRLSSGEKNLLQLFLRIGTHMTQNTIVLIDEFDVHLHLRWQHKLFNALKAFATDNPGVTVMITTHSVEILDTYVNTLNIIEKGKERELIKGGHLIEDLK